jgi:hypothetical protein
LIAAFTLPLYSRLDSDLLSVITYGMDPSDEQNFEQADQNGLDLNGVQLIHRNSGYHAMLFAFFTDPTRSGIYRITKTRYVSLAAKCLERLANMWVLYPIYVDVDVTYVIPMQRSGLRRVNVAHRTTSSAPSPQDSCSYSFPPQVGYCSTGQSPFTGI